MAPRGRVRLDAAWRHTYPRSDEADAGPQPPAVPFAVYLGDEQGRMRMVVFDLDAHDGADDAAAGRVWADADALCGLLEQAGLDYYVSRSGPAGGVHVWVPVSDTEGLAAAAAARIGRAAARMLPSLDTAPLHPGGLVRPPGSPHRHGGCAELLHPTDPADALSICDTTANTTAAFGRLAVLLGADEAEQKEAAAAPRRPVDGRAVKLPGTRRPMPADVRMLLDTPPHGDASAHLARILPRLALARWSRADVEELVAAEPSAPGLEHLHSTRGRLGRRPRTAAEQQGVLERQWRKAVAYAAQLPAEDPEARRAAAAEVEELATAVAARVAEASWWSPKAGASDRLVLQYALEQARRAGTAELDLDIRRVALGTGLGRSTAARALGQRLPGDGRLQIVQEAAGTQARRYRIVHPDHWPDTRPHQGGTQG